MHVVYTALTKRKRHGACHKQLSSLQIIGNDFLHCIIEKIIKEGRAMAKHFQKKNTLSIHESKKVKKEKTVAADMMYDTKMLKMMATEHEMTIAVIIHELVQKHLEGGGGWKSR